MPTAPYLLTATPADDTSAVAVDSNIVLSFSENVAFGSGSITISDGYTQTYLDKSGLLQTRWVGATDTRTLSVNDSQISISGNTVTINLANDLKAGLTYNVLVSKGFFQDSSNLSYAGINASGKLNFTTTGAVTAPTAHVDTILFNDTGVSSSDYITHSGSVHGSYSGSLGAHDSVQVSLDSGVSWHTASASAGSWSYDGAPGADGSYSAIARVVNSAGQSTASVSHSYTYDTSGPGGEATISDNALGVGETATVTVTFSEAVYNFTVLNATTNSSTYGTFTSSDGGFHWSTTVTPNTNTTASQVQDSLVISATDAAGNQVSNSLLQVQPYAVQTVPLPSVNVSISHLSNDSGIAGDFITNTASQNISGGLDGTLPLGVRVEVSLDGSNWLTAIVNSDTHTWSLPNNVTLSAGTHNIQAHLTDGVNVSTPVSHSYTLDTTAPTLQSTTVGSTIVLTLNEAADVSALASLTLSDGSTDYPLGVESGNVTISGNEVHISLPLSLSSSTNFSLDMDGGTISDLAGNILYTGGSHLLDLATDSSGNMHLAAHIIPGATSATLNGSNPPVFNGQFINASGSDKVQVLDANSNWNDASMAQVSGNVYSWSATAATDVIAARVVNSSGAAQNYLTEGGSVLYFSDSNNATIAPTGTHAIVYGGSGNNVITVGDHAYVTTGSGHNTVTAATYANITSNGFDGVTVGSNATVVMNGSGSTITATGSDLNLTTNGGSHSIILNSLDNHSIIAANGSNDTLNFNFSTTFTLHDLGTTYSMSGIEILNLMTSGSDITIGSNADVKALADGNNLYLAGDIANTLHIDAAQWQSLGTTGGYTQYVGINDSTVHLFIASGMGQTQ